MYVLLKGKKPNFECMTRKANSLIKIIIYIDKKQIHIPERNLIIRVFQLIGFIVLLQGSFDFWYEGVIYSYVLQITTGYTQG